MDERVRPVLDVAGELDVRETLEDLLISNTQLHLCHARTEAFMDAVAKGAE